MEGFSTPKGEEQPDAPDSLSAIEAIFGNREATVEKQIVEELLSEANLDRKTDLTHPIAWAVLSTLTENLEKHGFLKSAQTLRDFTDYAFRYLISRKRLGRVEYLKALQSLHFEREEKQLAGMPLR